MKTISKLAIPFVWLAVMIASCNSSTSSDQTGSTKTAETARTPTKTTETQTAAPPIPSEPPATPIPSPEPRATSTPPNPEDVAFWENMGQMPSNISISTYPIPEDPREHDSLFRHIPTQAWPVWEYNNVPTPRKKTLEEIGYELRTIYAADGSFAGQQLYKNNQLLIDNVTRVSDVYTFQGKSGPIVAFRVEVDLGTKNFTIENGILSEWGGYAIDNSAPILYQSELLWMRMHSGKVEVKKSNGDVVFSMPSLWMPNHRPYFREWDGHWILEEADSVVLDGEFLNQKLGFQKIFEWGIVQGKPTYFFRKGLKVGISHGGQILPLQYDEVAHGMCCSPAQNNPAMLHDALQFYAKQDGFWYYVVLKFKP